MCTKNYAEWRTGRLDASEDRYTQIVQAKNILWFETRVSNASGFYLRAIASTVNSAQMRAILEQLHATEFRLETLFETQEQEIIKLIFIGYIVVWIQGKDQTLLHKILTCLGMFIK